MKCSPIRVGQEGEESRREFITVNAKNRREKTDGAEVQGGSCQEVNEYIASGGDDALKKRGKSPSKMSFAEKYFESLGGRKRSRKWRRRA